MFSYYGTKRSLAAKYPAPRYDLIVEPFSGAAAYAMAYYDRDVLLVDLDPIVVATWDYLIEATPDEIMDLPDLDQGSKVSDFDLSIGARYLMGFAANPGSAQPKITATARCKWNNQKRLIADQVNKIKHWAVVLGGYDSIPNGKATWFIDPPYQKAGTWYRKSADAIDFKHLGSWCQSRYGQTIVCEQDGADWLPFGYFSSLQGSRYKSTEVIWTKENAE